MAKKIVPIKYTSRDFDTIKRDLVDHVKRYYPETFKDFNEASFGSLMLDTVSYVGDILSFYLDYQANESFLDTAVEYDNIIKHGRQLGFKFSTASSTVGIASFYISVPANADGLGPNLSYAPILKKGTTLETNDGIGFILNEDVRFDNENNTETRVSIVDPDTNIPLFYAIKAFGQVVSGIIGVESIDVGDYKRFTTIELTQPDIVEIISIFDREGNEYYEVDYLSQNIIYKSYSNNNQGDSSLAKEILKPILVPRRFVVDKNVRNTTIQFGASSDIVIEDSENMIAEPSNAVLEMFGKQYISSDSFDPTRLLSSDKLGISPSNTTLTITYRYNSVASNANVSINGLNRVATPLLEFVNESVLEASLVSDVRGSLEVLNEVPLLGDITVIDSRELKQRIENSFSTQNRAVTLQDYKHLVYTMPKKFGSVKRANIIADRNSLRNNLNLYILCEDKNSKLTLPNQSVKNNIKTWLLKHKMINDSIEILNGKIVNYGITFTAVGANNIPKYDILLNAIEQLKTDFSRLPDFGETFMITDVYDSLKKVDGLIDVLTVTIDEKVGGLYSNTILNIDSATSPDGRYINVPSNVVMELKYPDLDIKGTII